MTVSAPDALDTMLFDLDGTLLDTAADFIAVMHEMCREQGRPAPSDTALHQTVSKGARALVTLGFGLEPGAPHFDALHGRLLALYAEQLQQTRARLYPEMEALLQLLETRGMAWGVVTNKPAAFSETLLEALDLERRCQILVCPEHVRYTKPHPEPLLRACLQMGCDPARAAYVGDHPRDIESGRFAGLFTIAAAWGYLPESPALPGWGEDLVADRPGEICQWLGDTNLIIP